LIRERTAFDIVEFEREEESVVVELQSFPSYMFLFLLPKQLVSAFSEFIFLLVSIQTKSDLFFIKIY